MLSDFWPHGEVAQKFGVLRSEGKSERALFVINKAGMIRYVDVHDIDDQPDNEVLFRELAAIEGVPVPQEIIPAAPAQPVTPPQDDNGKQPALVMYCTDWCPGCRRARVYLKENNIAFREVNIARDRAAAAQVRTWTGGYETTPTFDIKGSIVVTFDVEKINQLLGIKA